ncbi:DUF4882 family protein [Acinetobacter sp. VNH17]|uniref:DUF4882 family protein n=1 Tax=Acinetobacter thutiue TaxID=2998078 RepID=A0ABT7WKV6_9GAMM|nr:DUF4882 family protein [Acinetobacter thutiue]MCY6411193.1 DUF4882 family protein [Acinetobacter thutiue]MDN0013295.1 DUF4882 family protein [Acinetobacter thutiue]
MKKIILGTLISAATMGSTFAACTYNFDATAAQLAQLNTGTSVFPNINNQKVGFNITANMGTIGYAAFSSAYAANKSPNNNSGDGDVTLPATPGIFAFEYKFKVPTYLLSGDEGLAFFPIAAVGTFNNEQAQAIGLVYTNNVSTNPNKNEFRLFMNFTGNGFSMPVTTTASGYQTIGIYVNMTNGQVGVVHNGVNKGYIATLTKWFDKFAFANAGAQYQFANNSSSLGQEVSVELITDHTKLQNTYPTGTTDICGNTI